MSETLVKVADLGVVRAPSVGLSGSLDAGDQEVLRQLVSRAAAGGLSLAGEGGFLQQMTKLVLEAGLEKAPG